MSSPKHKASPVPPPPLAEGGLSIQDRLNSMRARTPEPEAPQVPAAEPASPASGNTPAAPRRGSIADEMFLRQYSRQVQKRVAHVEPVKGKPGQVQTDNGGGESRRFGSLGSLEHELKRLTATLEQSAEPAPSPTLRIITPGVPATPPPAPSIPLPATGSILLLPNEQVAVFQQDSNSNGNSLDSVLLLNPNGSLSPEGISILEDGQWEKIGQIPPDHLPALRSSLTWNRHHIVFHLAKFTDARFVPHIKAGVSRSVPQQTERSAASAQSTRHANWPNPSPEEIAEESKVTAPAGTSPVRGQMISIEFTPGRSWDAVYWCEDVQGTVVAHNTNRHWSLMHLDLGRFQSSLVLGNMLSTEEIAVIENDLVSKA